MIIYKNSFIHYLQFGKGEKILFAFHGFSENGESFIALGPSLNDRYTIIAIDIPYHGNTLWNEPEFFTPDDLIAVFRLFLDKLKITRFSVLGFSMGGKCALFITKYFAQQIDELFLMASDGIQTNKLYNVAVYPSWGRQLFKTTLNHPGWFFGFIFIARKLNLISPWLHKFTQNHMNTKEKRRRLYDTWISMANFNPDIAFVKQKINEFNIRVYLFFGKRDEVIPLSAGAFFSEGLQNCKLIRLDRGHYFIDDKLNPFIEEVLMDKM
ncbi:MAG: alpha/beta fold hydrolase [Chitinophagales bacterium]